MSGCARSCALWLLGWTVAGAAFFYFFLTFGRLEPQIYWAAAGAGLFTATCVAYVIGIWNSWRERATLLDTVAGTPPVDGAWVAVSGTIRANSPLRTPLSNLPAVAYEYKISRVERSGKHTSEVTYYDGKALAPSIIATRQGSVRLLAVPLFDVPSEKIEHSTEVANALRYISTTSFQTSNTPKTAKIGVEQELTDDDGNFRVDKKHNDRDVDLEECRYSEKVIQQGEMICAFGIFSQQRGGLIPHSSWAHQARVMRGDATDVARQLRNRIIKYILGIAVFAALTYGIVWLYQTNAPKMTAQLSAGVTAVDSQWSGELSGHAHVA